LVEIDPGLFVLEPKANTGQNLVRKNLFNELANYTEHSSFSKENEKAVKDMRFPGESTGLFVILLALVVIAPSVLGHRYLETGDAEGRDNPVVVEDHRISWAAYGSLSTAEEVDYYRFDANTGEEIYASILIPEIKRLKDFDPELALIGPGLGGNEDVIRGLKNYLDIRGNEGLVAKSYSNGGNEVFFEPFTQTSYWERQELRLQAPQTGTYYVAVFHTEDRTGKYVLAIGEKEVFGAGDILSLPGTWWKVSTFAEKPLSTYLITAGVLGGIVVGSYFLVKTLF